ncbi:hypothetical protein [Vreelandella massiliensis]|uniref:hypothetical protein n=1 Tax=Vreelandella massiliensis TaxID=1816686 RepID=UPI00096A38F8|nr:hypothetical protein [Halomonas massiliensis]MYL22361.1 hypothetical protein [Halomonas alkaliantarctica]
MDTRESKTPEEVKEHLRNELIPEDYETSEPESQPEAKTPSDGIHKVLPLIIIGVGILVVALLYFGGGAD